MDLWSVTTDSLLAPAPSHTPARWFVRAAQTAVASGKTLETLCAAHSGRHTLQTRRLTFKRLEFVVTRRRKEIVVPSPE